MVRGCGRRIHEKESRKWITWKGKLKVLWAMRAVFAQAALRRPSRWNEGNPLADPFSATHSLQLRAKSACPKCRQDARDRLGSQPRRQELLPTRLSPVVFTLIVIWGPVGVAEHKEGHLRSPVFAPVRKASWKFSARSPNISVQKSVFSGVLHTWSQKTRHSPACQCVVSAGGHVARSHTTGSCIRSGSFSLRRAARKVFRGSVDALKGKAFPQRGQLPFPTEDLPSSLNQGLFAAWAPTPCNRTD